MYSPDGSGGSISEIYSEYENNINKKFSKKKGTLGGALAKEDNRPEKFRLRSRNCQKIVKKVLGIDKEKLK